MKKVTQLEAPKGWRELVMFDKDGRAYLFLDGAALFLEMSPRTLSKKLYDETGPVTYKKNGRLRFYIEDLEAFEKGMKAVAHQTNWFKIRKAS